MEAPGSATDEPTGHAASKFAREYDSLSEVTEALKACGTLQLRDVTVTTVVRGGYGVGRRAVYYVEALPVDYARMAGLQGEPDEAAA